MTRRFAHTVGREPIEFEMGGEDFTAPAILAPATLGDLLDQYNSLRDIDTTTPEKETLTRIQAVLADIFDLVLDPEPAARVRERLFSRDQPFDLQREILPSVRSLIEEYTDRPTQPSSSSTTGPGGGGTSSTAGARPVVSTPDLSLVTASST